MRKKTMTLLAALVTTVLVVNSCGEDKSAPSAGAAKAGAKPAEVARAFVETLVREDNAAMKKLLSKKALQKIEERERQTGTPAVVMLGMSSGLSSPERCQDEKIEGEWATVDCETPVPLIKEGGEWKVHPPYAEK